MDYKQLLFDLQDSKYAEFQAKQWSATIGIIEGRVLAPWTHNKAIQKALESYRITPDQKDYLRSLRV